MYCLFLDYIDGKQTSFSKVPAPNKTSRLFLFEKYPVCPLTSNLYKARVKPGNVAKRRKN